MRWDRVLAVIGVLTTPGLLPAQQDVAGSSYGTAALRSGNNAWRMAVFR